MTLQTIIMASITTISLAILFYLIYSTAPDVKNSAYINSLKNKAKINKEETQKRKQLLKEIQGNIADKTWMDRIQDSVSKSGLTNLFPKLTSERFIIINLFIAFIVGLVIFKIVNNIMLSLIFGAAYLLMPFLAVQVLAKRSFDKIDTMLVTFEDTMAANANVSSDLIEIFRRSEESAEEPIKSYISLFLREVDTGLTTDEALKNMIARAPSETFKNFIANLYIAYQNTADYKDVIKESNDVAIKAASNYEEQRTKLNSARFETLFTSGACVGITIYTISMLDQNPIEALFFTPKGNILLMTMVVISCFAFWYLVVSDNLRKR